MSKNGPVLQAFGDGIPSRVVYCKAVRTAQEYAAPGRDEPLQHKQTVLNRTARDLTISAEWSMTRY